MASEKIEKLIEEVKVLSVLELSELVHALEEEFGVSAAAAVAAAPAAGAAAGAADEQTEFNVVLAEVGASKMGVIKLVKEITLLKLLNLKNHHMRLKQTLTMISCQNQHCHQQIIVCTQIHDL